MFLILFILCSCTYKKDDNYGNSIKINQDKRDEILNKIMCMSLDEKIGQLFIVGFDGEDFSNENDISLIKDFKVGGLIFFRRNIINSNQVVELINKIKDVNSGQGNIPLFLSLDQEGGLVTRLPEEILKFHRASIIGEKNDEDYAYESAKIMGDVINLIGFNMNFAPVLDIRTNPNNSVIGSRAFSSDKEVVSKMAISTINGLKESNLIPVGKHYPGHGDTNSDSHYELPVLEHYYDRIKDVELYPFQQAINNGLDAILVSHLFYKNIDPNNIVTLSKTFLYDILRKDMGFRGVIITDDMIMKGLTNIDSIPNASVKAIKSGVDILLIGSGYKNIVDSINKVKQAVIDGEIDEFEIDRKVYNILRIKRDYKINNDIISHININISEINNKIEKLLNKN